MFRVFGVAAAIAAILSLAILGWQGLGLHLGPTFDWVLTSYEKQAARFFGLLEPLIRPALDALAAVTGWTLSLQPHWKHVVVLLWLNIGAESRNAWRMGDKGYSVFSGLVGLVIALVASIASGLFTLDHPLSSAFVALFPMFGYLCWAFAALAFHATNFSSGFRGRAPPRMWWSVFYSGAKYSFLRFSVGVTFVLIATTWSYISGQVISGLAVLGVWIAFFALYWLATGALQARDEGKSVFDNADFQHGWIMLSTIAGAIGLLSLGVAGI